MGKWSNTVFGDICVSHNYLTDNTITIPCVCTVPLMVENRVARSNRRFLTDSGDGYSI
jgi:hypothetical protein